jgi:hypothetical protein
VIFIAAAASACFAQSRAVDKHGSMMAEGRPFITDGGLYNNYDLDGSPLGLFDIDSSRLSAEVGYRYLGLRGFDRHDLSGQKIRMGEPRRAFFEVFYGPDFLSYRAKNLNGASLPLQRFGFAAASQTPSGFFGTSLSADGYIGTQMWEKGDSSRWLVGFDRLRIDMRSQAHPLVRVGAFANVALRVDTLYAPPVQLSPDVIRKHEDRSGQVNLPELGGSVDFGGGDMPVRSNLSISYTSSRFVYVTKDVAGTNNRDGVDSLGNENTIINDSIQLFWMAQGRVPVADGYAVTPGLLFGWSNNAGQMFNPHSEGDMFKLGDAIKDSSYALGALYFGLGTGFEASRYADLHIEYTASLWSLTRGNGFPPPTVTSRALHHTAFGVSTSLHEYVDMPLKVTPRIAYFISGSSGIVGSRWSDREPLNLQPGKSKMYPLYNPQNFLAGFTRITGFTLGVDGAALEDMLSLSFYVTFLSSKNDLDSRGGTELGLSAGFRL